MRSIRGDADIPVSCFGATPNGSSGSSAGGIGSGSSGSSNGSGGGPSKGGSGNGHVYVDNDPLVSVVDTLKTTPEQDVAITIYLKKQRGNEGKYNLIFYNCRTYSRQEFEIIKDRLKDGEF